MKKLLLFLFTLGFAFTGSFAQTAGASAGEEAAIKSMLDASGKAFNDADYKAYMSHWAKVPYASYLIFGEQTVGDALWAQMDKVCANFKPRKVNATRTNWNIRVKGDAAYVTFNQRIENLETQAVSETVEARYLEKFDGQWKIVSLTAMGKPTR